LVRLNEPETRTYERDDEQVPDVFGEVEESPVFVVTAY
jgi:hypothetical protein